MSAKWQDWNVGESWGSMSHSAELAPDSGTCSCVNLNEVPRLSALTCEAEMVMVMVVV